MNAASISGSARRARHRAGKAGLRLTLAALGAATLIPIAGVISMGAATPARAQAALFSGPTTLPYAKEYPAIPYTRMPTDNAIARLQARIDRGEVKLKFSRPRGYLDSILAALHIDPSSQTLVYSKTSLQTGDISGATPRAIYFNDDTYVAWVQGGNLELAAMDGKLDQVFYTFSNEPVQHVRFARKTMECLSCHDTYELSGGGVPRFLLMSTYVNMHGDQLTHEGQILTFDDTPLKYRWGGWYVTGQSGKQVHLGNILVQNVQQLEHLDQVRRGNIDTLKGLFDTRPYLTDKSDIVALLVLQHQVDVQNLITRVNFEVRTALAKAAHGSNPPPDALPEQTRTKLESYMNSLVAAMLCVDQTRFTSPIHGDSGFTKWFESQGPRDRMGRSLRDLDLRTRLFKYPLSYLVYTPAFDGLPAYARDYIYGRFADILTGRDESIGQTSTRDDGAQPYASDATVQLSDAQRKAILQILVQTKPAFARYLDSHGMHVAAAS